MVAERYKMFSKKSPEAHGRKRGGETGSLPDTGPPARPNRRRKEEGRKEEVGDRKRKEPPRELEEK